MTGPGLGLWVLGLLALGTGLLAAWGHDRGVRDQIPMVERKRAAWGRGDLRVGLLRPGTGVQAGDQYGRNRNRGNLTRVMDPVQTVRTV